MSDSETSWSPPGSSVPGILQARILEVGCHFLLQGIFLTQGSNPPPTFPVLAGGFFTQKCSEDGGSGKELLKDDSDSLHLVGW